MSTAPALLDLEIADHDREGVQILTARGNLDLASATGLCARVDAARHAGCRRLVIDLGQLRLIDTSGLRAVIGACEEFVASAGHVAVVRPIRKAVARLFALIVPDELVPLHSSVEDGVANVSGRNPR